MYLLILQKSRQVKELLYSFICILLFAACSSTKQSGSATIPSTPAESKDLNFLQNISITPAHSVSNSIERQTLSKKNHRTKPVIDFTNDPFNIENCTILQFKYAILMNLPVESVLNDKLVQFLDQWYGTPYRYGGTSKAGIDCSAFSSSLMGSVYGISIPRNSKEQYWISKRLHKGELAEGDLVFFNTRGRLSHVGVYLGNNKFAHASTSNGVMISDLDEEYFLKRYAGSGRIK